MWVADISNKKFSVTENGCSFPCTVVETALIWLESNYHRRCTLSTETAGLDNDGRHPTTPAPAKTEMQAYNAPKRVYFQVPASFWDQNFQNFLERSTSPPSAPAALLLNAQSTKTS